MGSQVFHADRQNDADSCFRNFADAPNKCVFLAGLFSWYTDVYGNGVYKKNHLLKYEN